MNTWYFRDSATRERCMARVAPIVGRLHSRHAVRVVLRLGLASVGARRTRQPAWTNGCSAQVAA